MARTARLLGLGAQVVVPGGVPAAAVAAIAGEGAQVTVVSGDYDEAVRRAADLAAEPGPLLVQDTAWPGYEEVPGWIVEGYSTLFGEIDEQLGGPADLLAVPVGVGSLAQAAVAHARAGADGPAVLSVEPDTVACVLASLVAGHPVTVPTAHTVMAGLNCATPSALAWPVLRDGLAAAVAITDRAALDAAADLAALGLPAAPAVVLLCTEGTRDVLSGAVELDGEVRGAEGARHRQPQRSVP